MSFRRSLQGARNRVSAGKAKAKAGAEASRAYKRESWASRGEEPRWARSPKTKGATGGTGGTAETPEEEARKCRSTDKRVRPCKTKVCGSRADMCGALTGQGISSRASNKRRTGTNAAQAAGPGQPAITQVLLMPLPRLASTQRGPHHSSVASRSSS